MSWHTETVPASGLEALLARIRRAGGTVACSRPGAYGVRVVWVCQSAQCGSDTFQV